MKTKRLKELDILRAIAFIFVVEQHSMGGFCNIKGISYSYYQIFKFFYTLAKPAVPIFICISSVSLFWVYKNNFNAQKYYIKRFTKIFIPYSIWSLIYLIHGNKFKNLSNFIISLLCGNACYHMWYMGMILRLFIYFPIILYLSKQLHKQKFLIRFLVFIGVILVYYQVSKYQNVICDNVCGFLFKYPSDMQKRFINITPLFWCIYFILGTYIALNYESFKTKILNLKIPVIIIYMFLFTYSYLNELGKFNFNRILSILYFIFSILIWYLISIYLSKNKFTYSCLNFISKYSFGAYLVHILLLNNYNIRYFINLKDYLAIGFSNWVLISILAPLLIKFINLIPYSQFITGVKPSNFLVNLSKKDKY